MLRDLVLMTCVLGCLWLSLRYPFAGVLGWAWLTLMQPHREVYGVISSALRINFTVAFVCILAWFFSKERKIPPVDATFTVVLMFLVWTTCSCLFAVAPSWDLWDRLWKVIALGLLIWATANSKVRIHALVWVVVLSLTYYGVKGGFLSVLTGGEKKITGPIGTMITDNNNFAVALLMTLPLVNYLCLHTANRFLRLGLIAALVISLLAIVGSYSRGAFLAVGSLTIIAWTRSRNKLLYIIFAAAIGLAIFSFMPHSYYARLSTLSDVDNDASFQGRILAWKVAFYAARDHFPFGAGLDGPQSELVYNTYFPGAPHAAHSIFFEVLGDDGFIGLGIYLVILFLSLYNCSRIRRATRNRPEMLWARDLATMIQLSLVAFCVGGSALSLAYYDMFFILALVLPPLLNLVKQQEAQQLKPPALVLPAFARRAN